MIRLTFSLALNPGNVLVIPSSSMNSAIVLRVLSTWLIGDQVERLDKPLGIGDGAKHTALHLGHLDSAGIVAGVCRACAVFQEQTLDTPVIGLAHRGMNAHVGSDTCQNQMGYSSPMQDQFKVRSVKAAFARF